MDHLNGWPNGTQICKSRENVDTRFFPVWLLRASGPVPETGRAWPVFPGTLVSRLLLSRQAKGALKKGGVWGWRTERKSTPWICKARAESIYIGFN